ncbi:hypothetical protein MFRU_004g02030 [Monilinia fructicola]|nr:hypothetical protein MFRU_004g02030 [Monilinia fructicola]
MEQNLVINKTGTLSSVAIWRAPRLLLSVKGLITHTDLRLTCWLDVKTLRVGGYQLACWIICSAKRAGLGMRVGGLVASKKKNVAAGRAIPLLLEEMPLLDYGIAVMYWQCRLCSNTTIIAFEYAQQSSGRKPD